MCPDGEMETDEMLLAITGMVDDGCTHRLERVLTTVPGVHAVEVFHPECFVRLTCAMDVSIEVLNDALASTPWAVAPLLGCC